MADPAIPIYGVHRLKYVLAWLLACVLLSGCTGSDSVDAGVDTSPALNGWGMLLSGDQSSSEPLTAVELPEDFAPHPDAFAESFSIRGLLEDSQQRAVSVSAQLDRIRVRDADASARVSEWSFSSVFRAQGMIASEGEEHSDAHELIARGALELGDSSERSLFVGSNRLSIEPVVLEEQGEEDGESEGSGKSGKSEESEEDGHKRQVERSCQVNVSFDANLVPDRALTLNSALRECPRIQSVGRVLNQWEALAVDVSGSLQSAPVAGHLWVTHTWGQPPQPGGAVLLDQLRLRVITEADEILLINANRSRRRSGKGPVTVLATQFNAQGDAETVELEWSDIGVITSDASGINYATSYRVSSSALELDLTLMPVVPVSEIIDALGIRWSGAVKVSGTHEGIGFVDIAPAISVANQE